MSRAVALLGSPRQRANSTLLAEVVMAELRRCGVAVDAIRLNDLAFSGCQACSACKGKSETCVLDDDAAGVLAQVAAADVVLLATPVYWGDVAGQLKLFIDRTYSYLRPGFMERPDKHRLPPGKTLVWIQVQGVADSGRFADIFPRYNAFFQELGYFDHVFLIRGCGLSMPGEVERHRDLLEQARQVGKAIAAG